MPKLKTKKAVEKRIKITSKGKLLRRHQFAAGHLKRKKSKGALSRQRKTFIYFKGESKKIRKALGL